MDKNNLPSLNNNIASYGQVKSRGKLPPPSNEGMRSGGKSGGRHSRGPGVSSLNSGQYKQGNNNSSVSGAGFKNTAAIYGAKQPILGSSGAGLNSNNVFNIPKYGGGGLGGGIGGSGIGGSGIGSNPYGSSGLGGGIGGSGMGGIGGNIGNEGKDSALGGRYNF
jgi:hypothetical protein